VRVQQFIVIVGGIVCVFISLYRLPVDLCACSVVYSALSVEHCSCSVVNSDCLWNCVRV